MVQRFQYAFYPLPGIRDDALVIGTEAAQPEQRAQCGRPKPYGRFGEESTAVQL
jgi:hypothetical protein